MATGDSLGFPGAENLSAKDKAMMDVGNKGEKEKDKLENKGEVAETDIKFSNEDAPTEEDLEEAQNILKEALENPKSGAGERLQKILKGSAEISKSLLGWASAHKKELTAAFLLGLAVLSPDVQAAAQGAAEAADKINWERVIGNIFFGGLIAFNVGLLLYPMKEALRGIGRKFIKEK